MRIRLFRRRAALLLALSLFPVGTQVLVPGSRVARAVESSVSPPPASGPTAEMFHEMQGQWDRTLQDMKSDLTPGWWHKLQTAEPSKWLDQYCSAKMFAMSKLCIVTSTAKALKDGKSAE